MIDTRMYAVYKPDYPYECLASASRSNFDFGCLRGGYPSWSHLVHFDRWHGFSPLPNRRRDANSDSTRADWVCRGSGLDFGTGGTLYGVAGGSVGPASSLTIDASGNLYVGGWDASGGQLLNIDPTNGNILTSIAMSGSGNSFVVGLDFEASDSLYGSRGNSSGHTEDLVVIDTLTDLQTAIGTAQSVVSGIWFDDSDSLSSSPRGGVPVEPAKASVFRSCGR